MNFERTEITGSIFDCIDEINQLENLSISKDLDAPLFGRGSSLDSLGLVNLLVAIEEKINNRFNTELSLVDEKAMSQKKSPFRNIETLSAYIGTLLSETE